MESKPRSSPPSPRRVHRASQPRRHNHPSRSKRSSPKHKPTGNPPTYRSPDAPSTSRHNYRKSSSPRRRRIPRCRTGPRGTSAEETPSPFHKGLQDILGEVFGNGARGPTRVEVDNLAGDLGDLIINALVAKLVKELKEGLLERLLIEHLEEIVSGVAARKKKSRPGKSGSDGKVEWKEPLMKRAFGLLIQQIKR